MERRGHRGEWANASARACRARVLRGFIPMPLPSSPFLTSDEANDRLLLRATAANHRAWMARSARALGGQVRRAPGVTWCHTPGAAAEAALLFPRFGADDSGEQLDAILARCRKLDPLPTVSCWSMTEQP